MQIQSRSLALALTGVLCLAGPLRRADALGPIPLPSPLPSPTPIGSIIVHATPTPNPTVPTSEESIPVVITYGDGTETRVQITRGIMEPVGIPPNQPVTVTLYLASGIPGSPVQVGLYDGGQISQAVSLPNPPPVGSITGVILVLADQTVRFNFRSGLTLGLYRTSVIIGPKEYLLQFYAAKRREVSNLFPTPPPITTPPPDRQP